MFMGSIWEWVGFRPRAAWSSTHTSHLTLLPPHSGLTIPYYVYLYYNTLYHTILYSIILYDPIL